MALPMYSCSSSKRTWTSRRPSASGAHLANSAQASSFCRGGPPLLPQANSAKPSVAIKGALRPSLRPRISPASPLPWHQAGALARMNAPSAIQTLKALLAFTPAISFLHRIALLRILAPEVNAILVGRWAMADHPGKQVLHHRLDLAGLERFHGHRRHVFAEIRAGVVEAALVGVGALV